MEELELTYLAQNLPEAVFKSPMKEVVDIYIPASAEHPILRIRRSGTTHEITKKEPLGEDPSHQLETTIPLTAEEFSALEKLHGKRIFKKRYYYQENGITYEIGVFQEALSGLVLVDVEFGSREAKKKFAPPKFCLADVSDLEIFAGGVLCGKSYSDIEEELSKFGYKKIEASQS
jgi:CYTH domain-containing protein